MKAKAFENELTYRYYEETDDVEAFHEAYEDAVETVRAELGETHDLLIDGERVATDAHFEVTSPGDQTLTVGEFAAGDADDIDDAVRAASAVADEWEGFDVADRVAIFRDAAATMRDRKFELAATISLENGKNRTEAMADVDEAIDFLEFYSRECERSNGYDFDTGEPTPGQHTRNLLRPYGVFGVIAPFNFPMAIFVGMTAGALLTGNTVVAKPAESTPLIAETCMAIMQDAGLPDGVLNFVTGDGPNAGQPLVEHEDVAGVVFTGSREVGLSIRETFSEQGKHGPVIAELGGKNPVIVSDAADVDAAVEGVMKGAFSFSGQKCSATSRVYVHEGVYDEFTEALVDETEALVVGPATERETFVSPVISDAALERYESITERAAADGTVRTGGAVRTEGDLEDGRFVEPTVVTDVPHEHDLARDEHFLPFVTVHPIADLDEGIRKSNDSEYGLCAGLFSEDDAEIDRWFDEIESGMCYANRSQSATTGALVQAQPFGGWKYSGTTGKFAGGYWYLQQFMREQTQTRVE
ncbi:delta-1-pyrroline-5-carboxylate dehydrogenase [Halarchaeum acidiphilum MH1-52-1]|uniref:L-glutamate gamma-semialdehyde dehydrogenase n=1 Tax=Halarchaeum acidiphilum MH1-52-1 TaxID=1261545 RepID=U2YW57_9EURY|nr:aldehyde dehydrogenase family protein [Halarchaeum acidiphilum]GAD53022.1 delta-1-pyrroline-5-carboxylate dehydrogenase [Halarchaeum acidiphilum MH1-52-1]